MTNTNRNIGITLIALGIAFITLRIIDFSLMSLLWPLWVLGPGLLMLFLAFRGEQAHVGWAVPGALIGGTGVILALLNLTGRWEAWSYMWAMYPVFVGLALRYVGQHNANDTLATRGERAATVGVYMLVGFGLFFELLIFGGFGFLSSALLPVFLIAAGAAFLIWQKQINLAVFEDDKPRRAKLKHSDPKTGINPALRRQLDEALQDDA